jgi:DNA-binding Lrp family transcriptional regulator/uncharacterized ParB-like nuclease family protein
MGTISFKSKIKEWLKPRSNLRKQSEEIKSFKENQRKEEAFVHRNIGRKVVPLHRIIGSVGRYHDFDSKFRLKRYLSPDRLNSIKEAMKTGKPFPPVKLYQIKDEYYVLDGNHRISAAKELERDEISAQIIEFIPSKNSLENILYLERNEFSEKTHLPQVLEFTEMGQYSHLKNQILKHQGFLEKEKNGPVSFESAALDWYRTIYQPLKILIKKAGLIDAFPERTIDDLYAYISVHQWDKGRERKYGTGIDELIPKNMEDFRIKMSKKKEFEYPEMERKITVFVLMKVAARKELRIIEKLYSLKEIREIHSVHGNVDIIIKIILKRNLLSSDSEVISDFVHNNVRSISGVLSTQTLIPGISRTKEGNQN